MLTIKFKQKQISIVYPGLISNKQNSCSGCYVGCLVRKEVQLEPDITVQFYNDPNTSNDFAARELIYRLEFIQISEKWNVQ